MAAPVATQDRIGEVLVREGLISKEQLSRALQEQTQSGMRLGYCLVKLGFVDENELTKLMARQHRMPAVDLTRFEVDPKIIKLVPAERKIGLSIRALKSDEFRTDWEEYSEKAGTGEATLGDHFKAKA